MILVTGGTGLAGSFVVRELRSRNRQVRILARPQSFATAQQLGAEIAPGDLNDVESVRRAASDVEGIVHVACTFGPPEVDIAAMQVLLDTWDRGAFVFISSLDVYGFPRRLPVTEDLSARP